MADIELNIPQLGRVVDGIAASYNYDANKIGAETKGQFAKRMLIENFIKPAVKNAEVDTAFKSSKATIDADVDSINIT